MNLNFSIKYFLLSFLLVSTILMSNEQEDVDRQLRINKSFLNLYDDKTNSPSEDIAETKKKLHSVESEFSSLNDLTISNKVELKFLKSINSIKIHPHFEKTIVFPKNFKISLATIYPSDILSAKIDKDFSNIVNVKAQNSLKKVTLKIYYLVDGKKYITTILVENFIFNQTEPLYLITEYQNMQHFAPIKVFKTFINKKGRVPLHNETIQLENSTVYLIKEDDDGEVSYKGKTYHIEGMK